MCFRKRKYKRIQGILVFLPHLVMLKCLSSFLLQLVLCVVLISYDWECYIIMVSCSTGIYMSLQEVTIGIFWLTYNIRSDRRRQARHGRGHGWLSGWCHASWVVLSLVTLCFCIPCRLIFVWEWVGFSWFLWPAKVLSHSKTVCSLSAGAVRTSLSL